MTDQSRPLDLKVPPVAVGLIAALLIYGVARLAPMASIPIPARGFFATILALTGFAIAIAGVLAFRESKTTVNPMSPSRASSLVASGVYRITRNPMYLGMAFVLLAWCVVVGNWLAFLVVPCFILYMSRYQIRPEERALRDNFGEQFETYKTQVRRWL